MNNDTKKGVKYMVIFQVLIGFSPILIKFLSPAILPSVYVIVRFGIAILTLIILISTNKQQKFVTPSKKEWIKLILIGILGAGMASNFQLVAIQNIGAILGSLVVNLEIPIAIFIGIIVFKEKTTKIYYIASALSILGLTLVTLGKDGGNSQIIDLQKGIITGLIAAVGFGLCTILGKQLTKSIPAQEMSLFRFIFGILITVLAIIITGNINNILNNFGVITINDWLILIFLGMVNSAIGFTLYYKSLHLLEVKNASLLITISTFVTAIAGLFIGETFNLINGLGAVLILTGLIILITFKNK